MYVRQSLRDPRRVLAVAAHEIGDVVADHASEPPALFARVRRCHRRRTPAPPRRSPRRPGRARRPPPPRGPCRRSRRRIAGSASWRMKPSASGRPGRAPSARRRPSRRRACRRAPTAGGLAGRRPTSRPSARSLMTSMASPSRASVLGLRRHPHRGVAAPDAADGAVAVHVVEGGEGGGGDLPGAGPGLVTMGPTITAACGRGSGCR